MTSTAVGAFSAPFAAAAAAVGVAWWIVLGALAVLRRPPRVTATDARATRTGRADLDLPREPPAVAGLLANGYVVTTESAPAVVLDLAARGALDLDEVQPGRTLCRVGAPPEGSMPDYERLVLDELATKAVDGIVPADALTTGPEAQSARWHRAFASAIVADAQQRGLTVPRWQPHLLRLLGTGLVAVAVLVAIAVGSRDQTQPLEPATTAAAAIAIAALLGGVAVVARLRSSLAQLPTPAGSVAAVDALQLAARLHENQSIAELPPAGVRRWDRLLAYAAAFGAAPGAVALLPMGAEDDRRAWSRADGRWRKVVVRYPRVWPPAWGKHPFVALAIATFWGVLAGTTLFGLGELARADRPDGIPPRAWDWFGRGALVALVPVVGVLAWAVWVIVRAVPDLRQSIRVSGVIVRDRQRRQLFSSGDDPDYWYYLAIDDGARSEIRAFRVRESLWRERSQGEVVTATVSPHLGFVRSVTVE